MQELRVVGAEDGALIATAENGDRFRLVVDEVLETQLRRVKSAGAAAVPKLRPRDIQAQIRAGLSAAEVAAMADVDVEYIERFEGPILAEREHMVAAALAVPVVEDIAALDDDAPATFGAAIRARLESLSATSERWSSWKDAEEGWIIKLTFTATAVDHDARWKFEPKRHILTPGNSEAITLSKQGALPDSLIPRLRAVEVAAVPATAPAIEEAAPSAAEETGAEHTGRHSHTGAVPVSHSGSALGGQSLSSTQPSSAAASSAAINRDDDRNSEGTQHTADLLQALRKRRGEREQRAEREARIEADRRAPFDFDAEVGAGAAVADEASPAQEGGTPDSVAEETEHSTSEVAPLFGAAEKEGVEQNRPDSHGTPAATQAIPSIGSFTVATPPAPPLAENEPNAPISMRGRRGRKSMPSWDEIVFGARTDED